jgi:hypothetical protein
MSSLQQNWRKGQNRFCLEARGVGGEGGGRGQWEEMTQIMYAHVNKLINKKWIWTFFSNMCIFLSNSTMF